MSPLGMTFVSLSFLRARHCMCITHPQSSYFNLKKTSKLKILQNKLKLNPKPQELLKQYQGEMQYRRINIKDGIF